MAEGSDATEQPAARPEGETFGLSSENPSSRFSQKQIDEWAKLYVTSDRTVRRWIAEGRKKGDRCPVDDPAQMPAWWSRHQKWSCPDAILKAAEQARLKAAGVPGPVTSAEPAAAGDQAPAVPATVPFTPVDLSEFSLHEGAAVANQRQIVAAVYEQMKRAYLGQGGDVDVITRRFEKAQELLRRLEKDDREDQKSRGEWISRAAVKRDLDNACELLRQMRESMERRVIELVPGLTAEQREALGRAIRAVRQHEDRVFLRLDSLKKTEDGFELSAA